LHRVQHSWSYEWWSATDEIALPATDKNTVAPTGDTPVAS
jgi:hypothetical protein